MAVVEVALEDGAPGKLTTSSAFFGEVVLWLDNVEVARFTHADLRAAGEKHVPLPDGSVVTVRARGPREPALLRNGVPLPNSATDVRRRVQRAAGALYLGAILQVCGGLVWLGSEQVLQVGPVPFLLLMPVAYATAGFFATRGLAGMLGAAAYYVLECVVWIVSASAAGGPSGGALLVRLLLGYVLLRGVQAAFELSRRAAPLVTSPDS